MQQIVVGVRNKEELRLMRKSGEITAKALKKVLENVQVGRTLAELDKIAEEEILRLGGEASFKTVPGYFWTTCLTVNDEVVHGIPRRMTLQAGDVLSVDLGAVYPPGGWHTDAAWSVVVGSGKPELEKKRFLEVGEKTLWKAIGQAVAGNKIGDISAVIQEGVEGAGYSVVKSLAGHGVGQSPHERPDVPTFGQPGTGLTLREGMTIAIEVIYTAGEGEVWEKEDGWTIATKDGSLGGLFEMSMIVGRKKPEVLTDWRKV